LTVKYKYSPQILVLINFFFKAQISKIRLLCFLANIFALQAWLVIRYYLTMTTTMACYGIKVLIIN